MTEWLTTLYSALPPCCHCSCVHIYFQERLEGHRKRSLWFEKAKAVVWPLSTNPTSCLWIKCRCSCHNEIANFPFDSGKSVTTWGRLPRYRNLKYSDKLCEDYLPFASPDPPAMSLSLPCLGRLIIGTMQWVPLIPLGLDSEKPQQETGGTEKGQSVQSTIVLCLVTALWGCLSTKGHCSFPADLFSMMHSFHILVTTSSVSFWACG